MKTIFKYTIFCTETQANKALKLGAQIDFAPMVGIICDEIGKSVFLHGGNLYWLPTTEQMINWLEEQGLYFSITCIGDYIYEVWTKEKDTTKIIVNSCVNTRKKAILAAIDGALDYLIQNKK